MQNSWIFIDFDTLSLNIDGKPYNVDSTHENWDAIITALKQSNFDAIPSLINVSKQLEQFVGTNITVDSEYGTITYHGAEIHNAIVDHIFRMQEEGFDITPMVRFLDNLMENPSKRAVDELYGFLQAGKMPITEDGHFLAYKRVRDDYKSVHDGKTDNSIGTVLEMPRNMVNENSHQTCSTGLHFCSQAYLNHFSGDRIVILKINPRDVVSIPADYNDTKGRACRYEVIGELTPEQKDQALKTNIFTAAVHNGIEEAKKAESGPQMTKGYFGKGYVAGYQSRKHDTNYYNGFLVRRGDDQVSNATQGQRDAWHDGCRQGWDDADAGVDMRFTTPEFAASATQPAQSGPQMTKGYFGKGYVASYRDYMHGAEYNDYISNVSIGQGEAYVDGYRQGWVDAENGVDMRFTTPEYEASKGGAADEVQPATLSMYEQGFKDGKSHRAKQYYTDQEYLRGYKAGRG